MEEQEPLEAVLEKKVKPVVEGLTTKFLGVNIHKISEDITTKLNKSTIENIPIDTHLPYKEAKKKFKHDYLEKVLRLKLGNISEAAKSTDTTRRSIHRLIQDLDIDVKKIKKELVKPYEIKKMDVSTVIEHVLENYKEIIHPKKLEEMYKNVAVLSDDILKNLPEMPITLKEAEHEFEKEYLKRVLAEHHGNISATARKIGLRYETLHRKIKALSLS